MDLLPIHPLNNKIGEMEKMHADMVRTQKDLVYKLGEIAETRSRETGYHVKRVAEYSKLLALYSGFSHTEAENLKIASTLHDIGKIGIPDKILLKPGRLTDQEFLLIQGHTQIGYELLRDSNQAILKQAATICLYHHERYSGGAILKTYRVNKSPLKPGSWPWQTSSTPWEPTGFIRRPGPWRIYWP